MSSARFKNAEGCLKSRYNFSSCPPLGKGSFGTVRIVTDINTNEDFACKTLEKLKIKNKNRSKIKKIKKVETDELTPILESEIMYHLAGGPNIVLIREIFEDSKNMYFIMELCLGGNLFNFLPRLGAFGVELQKERRRKGHQSKNMDHVTPIEDATRKLFREIMVGIDFCHNLGVMHRDIKMDNLVLTTDARNGMQIRLIDFGLSTFFKPGESFEGGVGIVSNTTPEIINGHPYDSKVDIWSTGIILYTMLSGSPPFWAGNARVLRSAINEGNVNDYSAEVWSSISVDAKSLLSRMLKESPEERFSSAQVLKHKWFNEDWVGYNSATDIHIVKRLREFKSMSMFKRATIMLISEHLLLSEETRGLKNIFQSFGDNSRQEILTFYEVKNGLSKWGSKCDYDEIDDLLHAVDLDGDGKIRQSEFVAATVHFNHRIRGRLQEAFQMFDVDNLGYILKDDLKKTLETINLPTVNGILKEVYDPKVKGKISFEAFQALME